MAAYQRATSIQDSGYQGSLTFQRASFRSVDRIAGWGLAKHGAAPGTGLRTTCGRLPAQAAEEVMLDRMETEVFDIYGKYLDVE
jgi:hypothetical protein